MPKVLAGVASVFAASRLLGLAREVGIAFFFGTSAAADRLSAAFVVASVASIIVGEAVYVAVVRRLGASRAAANARAEETFAEIVAAGRQSAVRTTLAFAIFGPIATVLLLGRLDGTAETIGLAMALAPSVGAAVFLSCANAWLTLERKFNLLNSLPMLYSLGALAALAVIYLVGGGPVAVAAGWSVGNVMAAATAHHVARPARARSGLTKASVRAFLREGLPVGIAYALTTMQALTDRAVAARLGTGSVAALGYADRLFLLPIGFVYAGLGPMVLGRFVRERAVAPQALGVTSAIQLRTLVSLLVPLSLVFAALAPWLVSVVLEYGEFGSQSTERTTAALDGLAVGIAAVAMSLVLFRVMQAVAPLRTLVTTSLVALVLNAALSISGAVLLGLYGITLSTSLVAAGTVQLQTVLLRREFGTAWVVGAFRAIVLPVVLCCTVSMIAVSIEHADVVSRTTRFSALILAAAAAFVVLRLGRS